MLNATDRGISKRHIAAAVAFAIEHIPQVDPPTLETFLALINTNGNFGAITDQQFCRKLCLCARLVPGASRQSLLILTELLDVSIHPNVISDGQS